MKDIFYTILIVWIVWRIFNSISSYKSKQTTTSNPQGDKTGKTTVDYIPSSKKKFNDDEGEYVEYEEMK